MSALNSPAITGSQAGAFFHGRVKRDRVGVPQTKSTTLGRLPAGDLISMNLRSLCGVIAGSAVLRYSVECVLQSKFVAICLWLLTVLRSAACFFDSCYAGEPLIRLIIADRSHGLHVFDAPPLGAGFSSPLSLFTGKLSRHARLSGVMRERWCIAMVSIQPFAE